MQDQVSALREAGVRAAFLNSSLPAEEAASVERSLAAGDYDLLYVAPERLMMPRFLQQLERLQASERLALFAIDEAHCVSQWGHDFRPEYMQLSLLHERFPGVPRIALTATADRVTREEIVQRLGLEGARLFVSSFDRPNIRYRIVEKANARAQLLAFLRAEHAGDAGIGLLPVAAQGGGDRGMAGRTGCGGARLSRRHGRGYARLAPGAVSARRRHRDGGDHRLRHGHRQTGCALRRASRPAQSIEGYLPGDRPRGPRRPAC